MTHNSKYVLVRTSEDEVVPYDNGVSKHGHVALAWIALFVVWAVLIGLFTAFIVIFTREAKYFNPDATTISSGDYVGFLNTACEPYTGPPVHVLSSVATVQPCMEYCTTTNSECKFFTHDITNGKCYFYTQNSLPIGTGVPLIGPTQLEANVFVKKTYTALELQGVFRP